MPNDKVDWVTDNVCEYPKIYIKFERTTLEGVLFSYGCPNKWPQSVLNQEKFIPFEFWRSEVKNQVVSRAVLPLK